jgi:TnpA family transposase
VTDHYATFGTKVIPASAREGLFALDEIFALRDRDSELAIAGHTTDTAGFTDLLFGVYDVVGLGFSPRIRDLADQRLWCLDDTALPDLVEPLMVNRVNVELIAAHWDDLLRLGASIHEGAVLPSLLLTKLQAFPPPERPGESAPRARPPGQDPVHPPLPPAPGDAKARREPAEQG